MEYGLDRCVVGGPGSFAENASFRKANWPIPIQSNIGSEVKKLIYGAPDCWFAQRHKLSQVKVGTHFIEENDAHVHRDNADGDFNRSGWRIFAAGLAGERATAGAANCS
jgi:hypothetical protein